MHSSIFHSRHTFAALVASLLISYAAAAAYTLLLNPELTFWKYVYGEKVKWAEDLTAEGLKKHVFVGGSSCAFQIDAGLLSQEYGIPSVNMGMHAGMGSVAITVLGIRAMAPGDTLVLALEPGLLTKPPTITPLGCQMLISTGLLLAAGPHQQLLGDISLGQVLGSLRPGLYNITTMLAKLAVGRPLYRYSTQDLHRGGALSTDFKDNINPMPASPVPLDPASAAWISQVAKLVMARFQSRAVYLIPLLLYADDSVETARATNIAFLREIALVVSPLHDPAFGVSSNLLDFSDTALHLNSSGMKKRTRTIAGLISAFEHSKADSEK